MKERLKALLKAWTACSGREGRRILLLIPLLVLIALLFLWQGKPRFDPNTVDRDGLLRLGFSPKQADGIVHYRQAGAVFRTASDFARCRMVSDRKFRELSPYIAIRAGGNFSKPETGTDSVREGRIPARCAGFGFRPGRVERSRFGRVGRGEGDRAADGRPNRALPRTARRIRPDRAATRDRGDDR